MQNCTFGAVIFSDQDYTFSSKDAYAVIARHGCRGNLHVLDLNLESENIAKILMGLLRHSATAELLAMTIIFTLNQNYKS